MSAPRAERRLAAASIERRFVVLTALRWLPTGLLIPASVLFLQQKGLSLAQIGLLSAVQSLTVLVLELPTGGLADALGRRPLLVTAGLLDLTSLVVLALTRSFAVLLVAWAIEGVYRALDSGPLEAWYVDASQADDPAAPIERGLARAGTAVGLAISAGALTTALLGLAAHHTGSGFDPLVTAVVVAVALRLLHLVAVHRLVVEPRRPTAPGARWARVRGAVAEVPGVVGSTVRLVVGRRALLALVGIEMLWGAGMVGVEMLSAPRLVELLGSRDEGLVVFGIVAALGWSICGAGSAVTGRIVGWHRGSAARTGSTLRLAQGAAVLLIAVVAGPAGLVLGYLGFYLVHGAANTVHYGLVHRAVGPEHRTTVISANSLASRLGSGASAIVLGALASGPGIPTACAVAAVLLALGAPLYRNCGSFGGSATESAAISVR
jgi:MFS family permease